VEVRDQVVDDPERVSGSRMDGVKTEAAALIGPFTTELDQRLDAGAPFPVGLDRQTPSSELFECIGVRCRGGRKARRDARA
jgi:hypothetical protein